MSYEAARATGADVPVCLDPRARVMRGVGEILSAPFDLPPLPAVLVNPNIAVATKSVFAGWKPGTSPPSPLDIGAVVKAASVEQLLQLLATQSNDLEAPAIALAPAIADVLASLRALAGCRLVRMSGSGATCFGVFSSATEAAAATKVLLGKYPTWCRFTIKIDDVQLMRPGDAEIDRFGKRGFHL